MRRARLHAHAYTILVAATLVGLAVPFVIRTSDWHTVYLPAARRLMAGGDLYDPRYGYTYPPVTAWLATPFTGLPKRIASGSWFVVNAACLLGIWTWSWRVAGGGVVAQLSATQWREHVVLWLGVLLSLRFVTDALDHQQTDLVIAALMFGGCLMLTGAAPIRSAALFGLAGALKGPPVLWSLYFVVRRCWAAAATVVAVALLVNLLPNLSAQPADGRLWVAHWYQRYVRPISRQAYPLGLWATAPIYNQSLSGTFYRLSNLQAGQATRSTSENTPRRRRQRVLTFACQFVLLAVSAVVLARKPRPTAKDIGSERLAIECAVVLMLIVLLSPASSKPHFVTVILPALVLGRRAVYTHAWWAWAFLLTAFVFAILSNRILVGHALGVAMLWLGGVTWCALTLLAGCLVLLWTMDRNGSKIATA